MTDIDLKARVAVLEAALDSAVHTLSRYRAAGVDQVIEQLEAAEALRSTAPAEGLVELPDQCPTCGVSWHWFKPAKCDGSAHFRCLECKAVYPPAPKNDISTPAPAEGRVEAGWKLVPVEPTPELLRSMAMRYDHGLGMPGYYDQPIFGAENVGHAKRLEATIRTMRQLHEEVVGAGFYQSAAAPQPPTVVREDGVEVKALEWIERHPGSWEAKALGLTYIVVEAQWWCDDTAAEICGSDELAKAAAQADFDARILSALTARTDVTSQGEA